MEFIDAWKAIGWTFGKIMMVFWFALFLVVGLVFLVKPARKAEEWNFAGTTKSGMFLLDGVDITKEKWTDTGRKARVFDPFEQKVRTLTVWKVPAADGALTFAAGEISVNVFGIYTRGREQE
jgi:hypothetical protein